MDLDELMKPKKPAGAVIGESLVPFSIADLEARLTLLAEEHKRVEAEIAARKASREAAEGFLYYVSFAGITGAGLVSIGDIAERVAAVRARAKAPVAVGFGVRDAQSAKAIAGFADAVVMGSALVERLAGATEADDLAIRVHDFLVPIRAALDTH